MLWRAARSLLFRLDPERAHHLALAALRIAGAAPIAKVVRPRPPAGLETEVFGLRFEHPLGLAAGFDKGEVVAPGLFALGFSHVEIGTITPRPQPGNPRPRLFRLPEHAAILNRMGFNNDGADTCASRLERLRSRPSLGVVGVNVGKNKATPNDRAAEDYLACIDRLHAFADYLVVNISSPNTPGLRQLQEPEALQRLLGACAARAAGLERPTPLLVKLAPDLSDEALDDAVDVAVAARVAGIIATNTTIARPGKVALHPRAQEAGGLSGAPLQPLATHALRRIYARSAGRLPIVGAGGIMDARDAYARIRAGASLVQVYTGYVYGGPAFARDVVRGMAKCAEKDGFSHISDAVGADARGRGTP
jgi:dihydroorotate dehydrogenase